MVTKQVVLSLNPVSTLPFFFLIDNIAFALTIPGGAQTLGKEFPTSAPLVIQEFPRIEPHFLRSNVRIMIK